ncbi:MAG: rod shape-determining protein MreC [Phycisphaerales bacterium]|nr:rod shape-determining protein MreC [Phycisphaerales bacterium]
MNHQPAIVRWSMPLTVTALLVFTLLPVRCTSRLQWFSEQAEVVIAPIEAPITRLTNWVIPTTSIGAGIESDEERSLRLELDRVQTQLYREREINRQLTTLVDQLQRGANLTPDIDVRQIHRPRIGFSGELLVIRSGTDDGLHRNTVAVVDAVQLLGRVSVADTRTCKVLPITSDSALPIMATVMLDNNGQYQLRCLLSPVGNGTLRGAITPSSDPNFPELSPGMEVRLLDDQWPRHAQMLVVGTIVRIENAPNQPLRKQIIVQPSVDLRRVPEVIFRLPEQDEGVLP